MKFTMIRPGQANQGKMTRSFEQMNKTPVPAGLREVREQLVEGREFTWYEYVPASYDGSVPVPLVVQLHGGGNDGLRWANMTIWHLLAEREGFLVVYPNAPMRAHGPVARRISLFGTPHCAPEREVLRGCVTRLYAGYVEWGNDDAGFHHAASRAAGCGRIPHGTSPADMIGDERPVGALPIYQMRGEKDVFFQLPDPCRRIFMRSDTV